MPSNQDPAHDLARQLLPLLDLTRLGDDDTAQQIEALCAAARSADPAPAAVCIYPEHVTTARRALGEAGIRVATVVNFPDAEGSPARIQREARRAIAAGADEIDMVLDYHALLRGDVARARDGVVACREACGSGTVLKLILETGALSDAALIRQASQIGIDAGVDFLKTSTGKTAVSATLPAAAAMLDAIEASGGRCGLKISGGLRTLDDAAPYLALVDARMGPGWTTPDHFRVGASALFTALLDALHGHDRA
ncbi:deoxyribose-phosphate aldolase [Aerolutibacter ruishenii]|uniref:Deoxyribose-phosphate aldolase n=1 Tax=Aerolutibacter ruishenii TaxID=686800 RepID=A0A562LSE2_9GAMM|nr:deoxyribose-phosphate aldolase [Lysobacter ruishenii]TWI10564.1 deoxyribose-phosphate aldolase [Lysobacter ruishenii]